MLPLPPRVRRRGSVWVALSCALIVLPALLARAGAGDVNGDGRIDAADVMLAVLASERPATTPPTPPPPAADVAPFVSGVPQGNGVIDAADLLLLTRAAYGEDIDGDGLSTFVENRLGLSGLARNSDGVGLDDGALDSDRDGFSNRDEVAKGTDPGVAMCTLASCNDNDPCTIDRCGSNGVCTHEAGNCPLLIENFEAGFTAFTNVTGEDEIDWTRIRGPTPSRAAGMETGPTADHTTGSGFYAYLETDGNNFKTAFLQGPCIDLGNVTNAEWTFFYHRQGSQLFEGQLFTTAGALRAEVAPDCGTEWMTRFERNPSKDGDEGNAYRAGRVDLTPFVGRRVQLRLLGGVFQAPLSDVAVDDIRVDANVVLPPVLSQIQLPVLQSPLPVTGKAKAGQRVELFFDGTSRGLVTAAADGSFSFSVPVGAGSHTVWAQAEENGRKSFVAENEKMKFIFGETLDTDPDLSGLITMPTVLSPAVVYTVNRPVGVAANVSLRIPAGTQIRFGGSRLIVDGALVIEGTAANPVRLMAAAADTEWTGIRIQSSQDSRLKDVRIEGATLPIVVSAPADGSRSGFIRLSSVTVVVPVVFGLGVQLDSGTRTILENSSITGTAPDNESDGLIVSSDEVTIDNTQVSGFDRGLEIENASPVVRRMTITGNKIGVAFRGRGTPIVTQSLITGNQTGILTEPLDSARGALDPQVRRNDIVGNGSAVDAGGGSVDLTSVDFSENWWGTAVPDEIATSINDRGQSQFYDTTPRVIFCPFLNGSQSAGGQLTPTGPNVLCGRISNNRTLVAGETYRVVGGLVVEPTGTLTVPARTVLEFDELPGPSDSRLEVAGRLDVQGTPTSMAVLRSRSAAPRAGSWGGIALRLGGNVTLRGALVQHGTMCLHAPVAASLEVADSVLSQCGGSPSLPPIKLGDGFTSGPPVGSITGTRIEQPMGNSFGDLPAGIALRLVTSFTLRGNTIRGADVGIDLDRSSPLIQGNLVEQNRVGILVRSDSSPVVNGGNRIIGNSEYGIQFDLSSTGTPPSRPVVNQNQISGNRRFNYSVGRTIPGVATLDARENFWGTTDPFAIQGTIEDQRTVPGAPRVDFCPFLNALGGALQACATGIPRNIENFRVVENSELTPGAPYVIAGTLSVEPGVTLTIRPATTLRFAPGAKLVINGSLVAESTAQDIVFRSNAASPTPGSWPGIEVGATSTGVRLDGVTIQHAVTALNILAGGTAAPAQAFTVMRSVLRDFTSVGIQCDPCRRSGTIASNRIENFPAAPQARVGIGIFLNGGALDTPAPTVTISSNTLRGLDRGVILSAASPSLTANTIEQNNEGVRIRDLSAARITGGNRIVNNGIGIQRLAGDGPAPVVNGNAIFGNATFDYASNSFGEFDPFKAEIFQNAEGNYWGTTDPLAIAAKVTTTTDFNSRPVDFVPFLNAEGGQPVAEDRLLIGVVRPISAGVRRIPAGADVLLLGSTHVPAGVTLEINSSRVLALPGRGIGVAGTLRLIGTPASPVRITPRTTGSTWLGIHIRPGSTGSLIDNTVLEHTSREGRPGSLLRPGVIDVQGGGSSLTLSNTQIFDYIDGGILAPRGAAVVYRDGATGRIDKVTIDNIARKGSAGRMGTGILIDNASPQVLNSTVRETATGIHLYGVTNSSLSGNTVSANDLGIFIEGTQLANQNPTPVINGNSIFGNSVPNGPVENIVFASFAASQAAPINARGNFFGVTTIPGVLATIVFRGEFPAAADLSGFLASAGGSAVAGTQSVFTTRIAFESVSVQSFVPRNGQTVTFTFAVFAQPTSLDVLVYDEADRARTTLLRTLPITSPAAGRQQVVWNGRNAQDRVVPDGAYKFVVRAQFGAAVDIFDTGPGIGTATSDGAIPSTFRPFQNEFFKLPYLLGIDPPRPARVTLVVRPDPGNIPAFFLFEKKEDTAACRAAGTCFLAIDDRVLLPGQNLLTWDGRDPNGVILSGKFRIDTTIPAPIQANAVAVQGGTLGVTGNLAPPSIEVKSNPYLITHSYEQFSSITYRIDREAIVTVKLFTPGATASAQEVITLVNAVRQQATNTDGTPRDQTVTYLGYGSGPGQSNNILSPVDGPYTFTIEARDPNQPLLSTLYKGVLNIRR